MYTGNLMIVRYVSVTCIQNPLPGEFFRQCCGSGFGHVIK